MIHLFYFFAELSKDSHDNVPHGMSSLTEYLYTKGNISMPQRADEKLTTLLTKPEEISSYIGRATGGLLHIIDYPPELETTFLTITNMFNAKSGPFAIIEQERQSTTDFYANCYNNVRMAICATYYNLHTFENLCKELEEWIEGVTTSHTIHSQVQMNTSGSSQKLCFEYEHFMFHQRATVDRIAFFLSGFFTRGGPQDNILDVRKDVMRRFGNRSDHPKHRYAVAIDAVVNRHQGFLDSIHTSGRGRGQTERDILSHKTFIPFVNALVFINPPGDVSIEFQATLDGRRVAPNNARAILLQRYNEVTEFIKDMLDTFFSA